VSIKQKLQSLYKIEITDITVDDKRVSLIKNDSSMIVDTFKVMVGI